MEVPFSHKRHAALKLKCVLCHVQAATGDRAGFPAVDQCKVCHVDMASREIPSQRVYELPDFVFFSHATHANAEVECQSCHGEVMKSDTVQAAHPMKMKWCVDCHKQNKAVVACNACHELGQ
ncbi:MAG: cytochrome c family protein [Acidobacteriota bacterium]|nr:cytochrome c family protein [Acidobacteriota bacterium]